MRAYYNEFDPYAAQWLENLIAAGHLPQGDVDRRDMRTTSYDEIRGYTQYHWFAGIGGWPLALRLAGWPDDEPVWTGSCPCQPYSAAGQKKADADKRNMWPCFRAFIQIFRPATVFGEQVASKLGREWLSGVRLDLEALGYAVGAADLCAAGSGEKTQGRLGFEDNSFEWRKIVVGAPHIRQRVWWVAAADRDWET